MFASDEQLCRQCRGRCCQGHPGLWTDPEKFFGIFFADTMPEAGELPASLAQRDMELRDLGGVAIPAPQWNDAGCIFLGDDGCRLPEAHRPDQCRALAPALETLLSDDILCSLPAEFGSGTARQRWREFWAKQQAKVVDSANELR